MEKFDWTRFTLRINIKASAEKLYKAWSTRKGIEEWFLRISEFYDKDGKLKAAEEPVAAGDTYKWWWFGWGDDIVERGTILAANNANELSFSFGKGGNCKVSINRYNDEYIVELIQDQIPDNEEGKQYYHLGCKMGWTFYLSNMKSILEGGVDLRNRDVNTTEMVNK